MINQAIRWLNSTALAGLNRAQLFQRAEQAARLRGALDAFEARLASSVDALGDNGADAATVLRSAGGCSTAEARRRQRRAESLRELPNVRGALAGGRLTAEHVDALARAAAETTPEEVDSDRELFDRITKKPADIARRDIQDWTQRRQRSRDLQAAHRRARARRSLRIRSTGEGMMRTIAEHDMVTGAQFQSVISDLARRLYDADNGKNGQKLSWTQYRYDALMSLAGIEPDPAAGQPAAGKTAQPPVRSDRSRVGSALRGGEGFWNSTLEPPRLNDRGPIKATPEPPRLNDRGPIKATLEPPRLNDRGPIKATLELPRLNDQGPGTATPEPPRLNDQGPGTATPEPPRLNDQGPGTATPEPLPRRSGGPRLTQRNQIVVVAHLDVISGRDPDQVCEIPGVGPISAGELARLGCDADLYALLFSREGLPLWHGRGRRTVTAAQWRALIARDRGCVLCAAAPNMCQAHHIQPWRNNGPTDIDNLALVCTRHHHDIHDRGQSLIRGPDGAWQTRHDPNMAGTRPPPKAPRSAKQKAWRSKPMAQAPRRQPSRRRRPRSMPEVA